MITSKEQKALELNSEYFGVSRAALMENAGKGIAEHVKKSLDKSKKLFIFAGPGGNGGDAFVCARHLLDYNPRVFLIGKDIKSKEAFENFKKIKERVTILEDVNKIKEKPDVIVDGIFGTGFSGEPEGLYKEVIDWVNKSKAFVFSIDIPSGLTDAGEGKGIKADVTLALHAPKVPAKKTVTIPIGIPEKAEKYCGPGDVSLALKPRKGPEHKGEFGKVLVLAGSELYTGCVSLCALSALRLVDLVYVLSPERAANTAAKNPDLITFPLEGKFLTPEHIEKIKPFIAKAGSVLIGNGLGEEKETQKAVLEILKLAKKPCVIDADGLKALKEKIPKDSLLTPHAGEFKILFNETLGNDVDKNITLVEKYAKKYKCTILLKGQIDIISNGKKTKLNETGNAGMTRGGTGDTLAGLCAGFLTQSDAFSSACAASFVNGKAGDLLLKEKGYFYFASELIDKFPEVLSSIS